MKNELFDRVTERLEPYVDLPENLPPKLREYVEPFQTERGRSVLSYVIFGMAVLSFFAFLAAGADTPANPLLGAPTTTTTLPPQKPSRIAGFNEIHLAVTQFGAFASASKHFCAVHSVTPEQIAGGLTNRTDLAGYDGYVITYAGDVQDKLINRSRLALTAGFFDDQGRFLGATEMAPCRLTARRCPKYGAPGDQKFRFVLQVGEGGLGRLGITPGSTVIPGGGCI